MNSPPPTDIEFQYNETENENWLIEMESRGEIRNASRKKKKFTDIILVSQDGQEFPVHKVILSVSCPYFNRMFQSCTMPCVPNDRIQLLDTISGINLGLLLDYIYTGKIRIFDNNAKELYDICTRFELNHLKTLIGSKFLCDIIEIDSCLEFWRLGDDKLKQKALEIISNKTEEFLEKNSGKMQLEELVLLSQEEILENKKYLVELTINQRIEENNEKHND